MALRTGHGKGRGVPHVEILPFDELPVGVAAPSGPPAVALADVERNANGTPAHVAAAKELGRRGGKAKAEKRRAAAKLSRLASELLPGVVASNPDFAAGLPMAQDLSARVIDALSKSVGGGVCPDSPASMVQTGSLQALASRLLFGSGDFKAASALANDARTSFAAAHEYCAKLAKNRPVEVPDFEALIADAAKPRTASQGVGQ